MFLKYKSRNIKEIVLKYVIIDDDITPWKKSIAVGRNLVNQREMTL